MSKQKPVEYKYRIELYVKRPEELVESGEKYINRGMLLPERYSPFNSFDLNDEEVIEILNKIIEIRDRRGNQ